jgi:hypothetical protein
MCPWTISSIFWWLSVQHILSGWLYVIWWMKCKSTRRYVSRLSSFVLGTNEVCLSARIREKRKRKRLGWSSQDSAQSGTPDSVRCARPAPANWPLSGKLQWRTTIIHRTVRWANDHQRNGRPRNPRATRGPSQRSAGGTGLSGVHRSVSGAPTSPKLQWSAAPGMEGNRAPDMNSGCPVVHRTVRCATRQKATLAFQECLQRLLAALGL